MCYIAFHDIETYFVQIDVYYFSEFSFKEAQNGFLFLFDGSITIMSHLLLRYWYNTNSQSSLYNLISYHSNNTAI